MTIQVMQYSWKSKVKLAGHASTHSYWWVGLNFYMTQMGLHCPKKVCQWDCTKILCVSNYDKSSKWYMILRMPDYGHIFLAVNMISPIFPIFPSLLVPFSLIRNHLEAQLENTFCCRIWSAPNTCLINQKILDLVVGSSLWYRSIKGSIPQEPISPFIKWWIEKCGSKGTNPWLSIFDGFGCAYDGADGVIIIMSWLWHQGMMMPSPWQHDPYTQKN